MTCRPLPVVMIAALVAVVVLAAWPHDAAARDPLTPDHVARLRSVTSAVISPDGKSIAYTLRVPRDLRTDKDGAAWEELYVVDADGRSRPYVTGEVNVSTVRWTPDGRAITYLARRGEDEKRALYEIPLDGGESRKIAEHGADIANYELDPSGQRLLFLATEPTPKAIESLRKKGFTQEVYTESKEPVCVWVRAVDAPDSLAKRLDLTGSASEAHWSPDGGKIALCLAPTAMVDDEYMRRRVHVIDATNGALIVRIDNPGKIGQVAWSPDGRQLAMIAGADPNDPAAGRLMIAPSSGGAPIDIIPNLQGDIADFAWRDNQSLVVLVNQGVWSHLDVIGLDERQPRLYASPSPIWSDRQTPIGRAEEGAIFTSFSYADLTGALALTGNSPRHPTEVYYRRSAGSDPVRLADNNPWLADCALAPQEVVRYTARDGLEIEGILIRPLNEQPGTRYPLIMQVHGGPEAHNQNGWLTNYASAGQVAAARGMAVFYPNYRASTGRGVEFSKMDHGDLAGKEFDDLVDGVDHLIGTGLVDSTKVGVTGGSYGGYATAWCATYYSDRFAAAVMSVGVTDQVSKFAISDIPNELIEVHLRKTPWENWQFLLERSPVYYADRSKTPTLILHGKKDTRVNPSQSLELYTHLTMRGKAPVRLVWYPDEAHGNRKAAAQRDYNLRMLQWLEHYLKGPGGEPPDYALDYGLE